MYISQGKIIHLIPEVVLKKTALGVDPWAALLGKTIILITLTSGTRLVWCWLAQGWQVWCVYGASTHLLKSVLLGVAPWHRILGEAILLINIRSWVGASPLEGQ